MLSGKNYGRAFLCQSSKSVSKILCTGPDMSVLSAGIWISAPKRDFHEIKYATCEAWKLRAETRRAHCSVRDTWRSDEQRRLDGRQTQNKHDDRSIDGGAHTHNRKWTSGLHCTVFTGDDESGWRTVITPRRTDTRNVINRCGGLKNASNKQKTKNKESLVDKKKELA